MLVNLVLDERQVFCLSNIPFRFFYAKAQIPELKFKKLQRYLNTISVGK